MYTRDEKSLPSGLARKEKWVLCRELLSVRSRYSYVSSIVKYKMFKVVMGLCNGDSNLNITY
jgi:hypothetical protein